MKEFDYDDVEIVALSESIKIEADSALNVECGRSLPFVRHKPTNRFFLLSGGADVAEADLLIDEDEMMEWERAGRLTLLPAPIPAFPGAVIVYAFQRLLSAAKFDLSALIDGKTNDWRSLREGSSDIMFACMSERTSEKLMNTWAELLMEKSNDLLVSYLSSANSTECEEAEQILLMARAAARERSLRERIYLRYAAALLLLNRFDTLQAVRRTIKHSFPGWKEETFFVQVENFVLLARMRAAAFTSTGLGGGSASSQLQTARQKAAEAILQGAAIISKNQNENERIQLGQSVAQEYQDLYGVDEESVKKAIEATEKVSKTEDPILILNEEIRSAYAAEPAIHNPGVLNKISDGETLTVNVLVFRMQAIKYREAGIKQGEIANQLAMKAVAGSSM